MWNSFEMLQHGCWTALAYLFICLLFITFIDFIFHFFKENRFFFFTKNWILLIYRLIRAFFYSCVCFLERVLLEFRRRLIRRAFIAVVIQIFTDFECKSIARTSVPIFLLYDMKKVDCHWLRLFVQAWDIFYIGWFVVVYAIVYCDWQFAFNAIRTQMFSFLFAQVTFIHGIYSRLSHTIWFWHFRNRFACFMRKGVDAFEVNFDAKPNFHIY